MLSKRGIWLCSVLGLLVTFAASALVPLASGAALTVSADSQNNGASSAFCDGTLAGVISDYKAMYPVSAWLSQSNMSVVGNGGSTSCWQYAGLTDATGTYFIFGDGLGPPDYLRQYFVHGNAASIYVTVAPISVLGTVLVGDLSITDGYNTSSPVVRSAGSITSPQIYQLGLGSGFASSPDEVQISGHDIAITNVTVVDPVSANATATALASTPTVTPTVTGAVACGVVQDCYFSTVSQYPGSPWYPSGEPNQGNASDWALGCQFPCWSAGMRYARLEPNQTSSQNGLLYQSVSPNGSYQSQFYWRVDPQSPVTNTGVQMSIGTMNEGSYTCSGIAANNTVNYAGSNTVDPVSGWYRCNANVTINSGAAWGSWPDWVAPGHNVWIDVAMPCIASNAAATCPTDTSWLPVMCGGPYAPSCAGATATAVAGIGTATPTVVQGVSGDGTPFPTATPTGQAGLGTATPVPTWQGCGQQWCGDASGGAASVTPGVNISGTVYLGDAPCANNAPAPVVKNAPAANQSSWSNLPLIGGLTNMAGDILSGIWNALVGLFVPQHLGCDINPLVDKVKSHVQIPMVDVSTWATVQAPAVGSSRTLGQLPTQTAGYMETLGFNARGTPVPVPTTWEPISTVPAGWGPTPVATGPPAGPPGGPCLWFGVPGVLAPTGFGPNATRVDVAVSSCEAPWSTLFPTARTLVAWAIYVFFIWRLWAFVGRLFGRSVETNLDIDDQDRGAAQADAEMKEEGWL